MKFMLKHKAVGRYGLILAGTLLMAMVTAWFYDPVGIVTGGFGGIAIIVKRFTDIPLWVTTLALNIPLFIVAVRVKGWKFMKDTVIALLLYVLYLAVLPDAGLFKEPDLFLQSVVGGVVYGIGLGMIFYAGATTGGTDTLAALIHVKLKHYSVAGIMQVLDGLVVVMGLFTFGVVVSLYSLITIWLCAKLSDTILEGSKFAKAAYIISDRSEEIAKTMMTELERGATGIYAEGMYSGKDKKMIFVVVSKKEIVRVKEIAYEFDPNAFVIVTDAREVLGEGFDAVGEGL